MQKPSNHKKESKRIESLKSYLVLDTESEEEIDNLTQLASEICETPISLVSLIDENRQWFKSKIGLEVNETSRDVAFCAHAINEKDDLFIIEDARKDKRFFDNPLVTSHPYVIFYAGVVLKSDEDLPLGTLCVIDNSPRKLSDKQIRSLKTISKQIMNLLNYKKSMHKQEELRIQLVQKNRELERFASIAAHDLKSPLANIMSAANLFSEIYASQIDTQGNLLIDSIEKSGQRLKLLVDGLLEFTKIDDLSLITKSKVDLIKLTKDLTKLIGNKDNIKISLNTKLKTIKTYPILLDQILINLFSNSLKYSNKKIAEIELNVSENSSHYLFIVKDNGPGISKKNQTTIFNLFQIASAEDQFGNKGNGIGLATVKKIIEKLGGKIRVESEEGQGAEFHFSISK
ncbi:ATP-binding protein [Flavobacterium sp.]|jgi:signal transduction histidine kinase|uniref:sensor histidine kinase n=1 Tax=Flavobacterium sp. TaxID=239 RepID=UPI0037C140DC